MASQFQDAGRMLMGLSAGLQGQGQQFIANQQRQQLLEQQQAEADRQRMRELELERMKTVFTDSQGALKLANEGRFDLISKMGQERMQILANMGVDSSDTQQLTVLAEMAAQGNSEAAENLMKTLKNNVAIGEGLGVLEAPEVESASVKSSDILEDGTVVMAMTDGSTIVNDAEGNRLKGKARVKAIRDARKFEAEQQRQRAEGRTLGTDPIKTSIKLGEQAFQKIDGVRKNIGNLDQVISAIDRGARSGVMERFFPSIKAASIELDNLRNRLGLDVIGDVTFGALSEGELNLALDTALPTGLNEQELRKWAVDKKAAQEVYAKELEKAASFFSRGGNIADYIAIRRGQEGQAPAAAPAAGSTQQPQQGQVLRFDSQGNLIQ